MVEFKTLSASGMSLIQSTLPRALDPVLIGLATEDLVWQCLWYFTVNVSPLKAIMIFKKYLSYGCVMTI